MRPSSFKELEHSPNLRKLLAKQVDMQFGDAHSLLQLPSGGLGAGCNLTLANLLFALISGTSVFLFEAEFEYLKRRNESGSRFKRMLRDFYPWGDDDCLPAKDASELLYTWARNPLTHSFGIGKSAHLFPGLQHAAQQPVWLYKWPLSPAQAGEVQRGESPRPAFLPPTLRRETGGFELSVPTLSWGTTGMLRKLFSDDDQLSRAEILAGRLLRHG